MEVPTFLESVSARDSRLCRIFLRNEGTFSG